MRRRHLTTGQYTEGIGNGLFALKKPGDHLLNFVGDTITNQQYISRTEAGRGGYILANSLATYYLDCFDHARNGTCWESMANSPYDCRVPGSTSMVTANAQLVVFAHGNHCYTWSIKAIKPIERGQEVLILNINIHHTTDQLFFEVLSGMKNKKFCRLIKTFP